MPRLEHAWGACGKSEVLFISPWPRHLAGTPNRSLTGARQRTGKMPVPRGLVPPGSLAGTQHLLATRSRVRLIEPLSGLGHKYGDVFLGSSGDFPFTAEWRNLGQGAVKVGLGKFPFEGFSNGFIALLEVHDVRLKGSKAR